MPIRFKQQCGRCRKNYVKVSRKQYFVLCYDCQKGELAGEVKDPEMKKMFAIPEEFYKDNAFLRDIKVKYLRYGSGQRAGSLINTTCITGITPDERRVQAG